MFFLFLPRNKNHPIGGIEYMCLFTKGNIEQGEPIGIIFNEACDLFY